MAATAIISVVTAVSGAAKQESARKDRKKAMRIQERRRKLQQQRQVQQAIRQAQIQRAALIAASAAQGVQGSSAVIGAAGSIQSQTGGSLGFAQQTFDLRQQAASRLASAERQESITSAGISIGSSIAGGFSG